jgi:hypothetical protein
MCNMFINTHLQIFMSILMCLLDELCLNVYMGVNDTIDSQKSEDRDITDKLL